MAPAQMNQDLRDILTISQRKVSEPQEEEALINTYEQDQLDKFLEVLQEKQDSGKKPGLKRSESEENKMEEEATAQMKSLILKNVQRKSKDYSGLKPIREQRTSSPFNSTSGRRSKSKHDVSPGPSGSNSNRGTGRKAKQASQLTSPEDKRYDQFMNFLDKQIETPLQPVDSATGSPYISNSLTSHFTSPHTIDAEVAVIGAKEKLVGYEMELQESQETIRMLKHSLDKQKKMMVQMQGQMERKLKEEVDRVKLSMEGERHKAFSFSEELLASKRKLQEENIKLKEELEEQKNVLDKKIKQTQESHKIELRRNKDAWLASEQMRRQQWEKQREHEIKANTVKSLQPEIERMIKSKDEKVKEIRHELEKKKREEINALQMQFEKRMKDLREQMNKEREMAVDNERESAHRNLKKQEERMEEAFEAERKRWKKTMAQEAEMKDNMRKKDYKELQSEMRALKKELQAQEAVMLQERKKILEQQEQKHLEALDQLRKKMHREHEGWKEIFEKQKARQMEEFKIATIEEIQREKDMELEGIIERLSEETQNLKLGNRVQLEKERKEIEAKQREILQKEREIANEWRHKYQQQKEINENLNSDLDMLSKNLSHNERERNEGGKKIDQLQKENEQLNCKLQNYHLNLSNEREMLERKHMESRAEVDKQIRVLNAEIQQEKNKSEEQIRELRAEHNDAREKMEVKVKAFMEKKDEHIRKLQEELKLAEIKLQKSRELLKAQKMELFG